MILGISGRKLAGKDTLADNILRHHYTAKTARKIGFSDGVYAIAQHYFDMPINPPDKEVWRPVLQAIGMKMREIEPNVWVMETLHRCWEGWFTIIKDVRFPNEVDAIHGAGGLVIRLLRSPLADAHESETLLNGYKSFDYTIDNRECSAAVTFELAKAFLLDKGYIT